MDERLKEFDILRAFAFIFVVAQHTVGGLSFSNSNTLADSIILKFIYVLAKPAVPMFLFLSAALLFHTYKDRLNLKNYYLKRLKYIFIPYVVWSAVNMIDASSMDKYSSFIIVLIAGDGRFHLWYMGMIIRLYLYFPLMLYIAKFIHGRKVKIRILILLLSISAFYLVNIHQAFIAGSIKKVLFSHPTRIEGRIINISPLFWFIYFLLGIYAGLNYEYLKAKLNKYKIIVFTSFILVLAYQYLKEFKLAEFLRQVSLFYMILSILTFYLLSIWLSGKNKIYRFMRFISSYSFAAYMAHIIIVNYCMGSLEVLKAYNRTAFGMISWILASLISPF